ncbi:hypothetical protein AJ79_00333 [Helicocarpus griseus UAMH5409]|uniref:Hsp70-like protein n=1 Tax=Helicocarpus griseus UAMH5409 TaxID=1447875 RepID=A0A2B7Y383_9EURO|nr:hypothetical protein AJ79_00333 [Helicocarpus griseus UAMH5409]
MASRKIPPETIIIGIDLGLTYTGVTFSTTDMLFPLDVDRWPGTKAVEKKVPTKLCYRAGCKKPVSWGFECCEPDELDRGMDVIDCFKLYLDPDFHFGSDDRNSELVFWSNEDVQTWFIDFLAAVREYIVGYIRREEGCSHYIVGDWKLHPVEYIFSFPTTWQNSKVIEEFSKIVANAGFGDCEAHSVEIKMSEAAAAAVYSARNFKNQRSIQNLKGRKQLTNGSDGERIQQGDTILICDAGGGTTDVAVLKVLSTKLFNICEGRVEEMLELEQIDFVNGTPIGSVRIDQAFQSLVENRLKHIDFESGDTRWSPMYAARDLTKGNFQAIKKSFGNQLESALDKIALRVPGLKGYHAPEAGFENGRIVFKDDDIRKLFDNQIRHIFSMVDEQFARIRDFSLTEKVTHLVLSGGLGSSRYVQDCFREAYGHGKSMKRILISEEPQLAVCRGLVIDRIHRLRYGQSLISTRRSCRSYGIVFNKKVKGSKSPTHRNEDVQISPYDGKAYVVNHIEWLVRQGQLIHQREYISEKFNRVFDPKSSEISWKDFIAMSQSPATRLPRTTNQGDARVICEIESRVDRGMLGQHTKPVKRQKWWGSTRKPESQEIQYEVRLFIGFSHLKFKVFFENQVIGESEEIAVQWQYTSIDEPLCQDTEVEWPVDWTNGGYARG